MSAFLFCVVLFVVCWWKLTKRPILFPPGPYRWPIIGNIMEFKRKGFKPHDVAADLCRRYGNVVGLYLSSNPVVIVSGLDEIKEILSHPDCQGRPPGAVRVFENDVTGLLFTQGDMWRYQRRFALRHLRDLGLGKRALETLIHDEIDDMVQDTQRRVGKDFKNSVAALDLFNGAGANLIFNMLAGERFRREETQLPKLIGLIKDMTTVNDASGGIANSFPFLLKYAQWLTEYGAIKKAKIPMRKFLLKKIKDHQDKYSEDDQQDLIDLYLTEIKKQIPGSTFHVNQLISVCFDIFVAGSDTTVGTLTYGLLQILLQPRIQKKMQDELDAQVGRDRRPSVDDKARLPYMNAVIQEILRTANVVPISVPHATMEHVHFRGYFIPKDTRIIINLRGLQMDPKIWGDPETFRPERFIGTNGELLSHEALMPFGHGKRVCIGESMARMNLLLNLSTLMQNFTLSLPEGEPTPKGEQVGGFVLTSEPYKVKLTPRI